jgi:hypothetical protein
MHETAKIVGSALYIMKIHTTALFIANINHISKDPVQPMHEDLYRLHDELLSRKQAESASLAERQAKMHVLENQYDELQELPALSSFMQISDAMDDVLTSSAQAEGGTDNDGPVTRDGFDRMKRCRMALDAIDQGGWKRSYHQKLFHEAYIAACARPFWKLSPPGSFARAHQKILDINNWDNLAQEILISTPRRQEHINPKPVQLCNHNFTLLLWS